MKTETETRYARIEVGTHWTEGCGSERPQLLQWSVRYQSRAGECCEWYATESEAQARLAQARKLITI